MLLFLLPTPLGPELVHNHINTTPLEIETHGQMLSFLSCCLKIQRRAKKWREIEGFKSLISMHSLLWANHLDAEEMVSDLMKSSRGLRPKTHS